MTIELHTWNTQNGRKISVALEPGSTLHRQADKHQQGAIRARAP